MQKFWPLFVLIAVGLFSLVMLNTGEGDSKAKKTSGPIKQLEIEDVEVGEGEEAKRGDTVEVHYTGRLASNGQQFDSSVGKDPFAFTLGVGQVIRGWDQGVAGMKVGGKRTLKIPSELGYGSRGAGNDIPPNADLIFDVELLRIVPPAGK